MVLGRCTRSSTGDVLIYPASTWSAGDAADVAEQPGAGAVAADGGDAVKHQHRRAAAGAAGSQQASAARRVRPPCVGACRGRRLLCGRDDGHQAQPLIRARAVALLRRVRGLNRRQDAVNLLFSS